jgi:signal transduction histidine kinase
LEQVVSNLVSNAVKYTPYKGTIDVNASSNDQFVVVSVKDNGIGIPLAEQPFIFDKFYRVQSEETAGISGTGLGLSIVKSIVEKHFGRTWVESEPGRGSNFVFILPKVRDAMSEVQASAA